MMNAQAAFKSEVWKHFGFVVSRNEKEEKVTDKQTICKQCQSTVQHTSGITSNMRSHLTTQHPGKYQESVKKFQSGQKTLHEAFTTALPHNCVKAQDITGCIQKVQKVNV
ncbi:hypothetical protein AMECASPLE_035954 [Ameca splendens]|uniref:BED-type domain-containing protein n=1 Tax=Ameca splendens TaxID=208324 RepID=A0ABV0XKP8_9TELE